MSWNGFPLRVWLLLNLISIPTTKLKSCHRSKSAVRYAILVSVAARCLGCGTLESRRVSLTWGRLCQINKEEITTKTPRIGHLRSMPKDCTIRLPSDSSRAIWTLWSGPMPACLFFLAAAALIRKPGGWQDAARRSWYISRRWRSRS